MPTDEEIERAAVASILYWEEGYSEPEKSPEVQAIAATIRRFVAQAKAEAYAEAAGMVCVDCLNGRQVEQRGEYWYHPAHSYWPEVRCAAEGIRALAKAEETTANTQRP